MSRRKRALIDQARERHGEIQPCGTRRSLAECFTEEDGFLMLWFNSPNGTTHMIKVRAHGV